MQNIETGAMCVKCGKSVAREKWICRCGHIIRLDNVRYSPPGDRFSKNTLSVGDSLTPQLGNALMPTIRFDPVGALSEIFMGRVAPSPVPHTGFLHNKLAPLELYLLTHVDGKRSIADIIQLTGLRKVEISVLMMSLMRIGCLATTAEISIETNMGEGMWSPTSAEWTVPQTKEAQAQSERVKAQACREVGDIQGAVLHMQRATILDATDDHVAMLEDLISGEGKRCTTYYKSARQQLTQNNPTAAINILQKGLMDFPNEAGFHNLMGVAIMAAKGNGQEALSYVRSAVGIDPENTAYQENYARLQRLNFVQG